MEIVLKNGRFVNDRERRPFVNDRFVKNNRTKTGPLSFSKTIVIRFLKVQNKWFVFKNNRFFQKRSDSFYNML